MRRHWALVYLTTGFAVGLHAELWTPPEIPREFRAAWVATVYNIDWPSRAGLASESQQREFSHLLDKAVGIGLNAIILQVRPAADALYRSTYEPWSPYLTGEMDQDPGYDPLAFAIEEAHRRGLELHAWFNPFRAQTHHENPVSENHIARTRRDWVKRYGNYLWLDPGNPEVRLYSIQVILDVVERYDVDGAHIDDYFYPYPFPSNEDRLPFPDEDTFERFGSGEKDAWRRSNIDRFVKDLYEAIKEAKPWVMVGISPFGIWRPGVPEGTEASLDAFGLLYADARKWLREGWMDYLMPQLYWSIDSVGQSFPKLLRWWASQNPKERHLWPGIATDRVGERRPASEMVEQISLIRKFTRGFPGHAHWSANSLITNQRGVGELLERSAYGFRALTPPSHWLKGKPPATPNLIVTPTGTGQWRLHIKPQPEVRFWVLQRKSGEGWTLDLARNGNQSIVVDQADAIALSGLGSTGLLSRPAIFAE